VERLRSRATHIVDTSGEPLATRALVDDLLDDALRTH
jgi:hypothetical protein